MADYPKPSLTADAVVLCGQGEQTSILLIERTNEPFRGRWAFPGGFADPYEPVLTTCVRELEEETGLVLNPWDGIPLSLRCRQGRDPRGWTISQPVLFHLEAEADVRAGDDASRAQWIPLDQIETLAFDHGAILLEALACFWHEMPTFKEGLQGIQGWGRPNVIPGDVVFFGGTFNPWHRGHQACIDAVPEDKSLIVVPDGNPFKQLNEQDCFWAFFRGIQKQVAGQGMVFPGFCGLERINPTVSWLPVTSWEKKGIAVGDDCFEQLLNWYDVKKLFRSLDEILVVPRLGNRSSFNRVSRRIQEIAPGIAIKRLGDHEFQEVSSTKIRNGNL